jgi:hypothetical protein
METTIGGLADGLYFLTLASKNFCEAPLNVHDNTEKKSEVSISVTNENHQNVLTINNLAPESSFDIAIHHSNGTLIAKFENQTNKNLVLGNLFQNGLYLVSLHSKNQKVDTKIWINR